MQYVLTHVIIWCFFFFFLMLRRPPRSTLFPTRRSSDLRLRTEQRGAMGGATGLSRAAALRRRSRRSLESPGRSRLLLTARRPLDRKSTRLNSSHSQISYAVFCLKKKKNNKRHNTPENHQ